MLEASHSTSHIVESRGLIAITSVLVGDAGFNPCGVPTGSVLTRIYKVVHSEASETIYHDHGGKIAVSPIRQEVGTEVQHIMCGW
jgi:hypothetical protein